MDSLYKSVLNELKRNDYGQYGKFKTLALLLSEKVDDKLASERRDMEVVQAFAIVASVNDSTTATKNWHMIRSIERVRNTDQHVEQWEQKKALEKVNEFFKCWKTPDEKKYYFNYEKIALKDILERVFRKNYYH